MKRWWLVLLLVGVAGGGVYWVRRGPAPPEIPFAKVRRERLVSILSTNGKVEPVEFSTARAQRDGLLSGLRVKQGDRVEAGQVLAVQDVAEARADLVAAEARAAAAQAELAIYDQGGSSQVLADLDAAVSRAEADRDKLRKDLAVTRRLVARQAAPAADVADLEDRLARTERELASLAKKKAALVSPAGRAAAAARLRDAEAAARLAQARIAQAEIRAPISGALFHLALRNGSFAHSGDVVAEIGRLDRLKVVIYVDEPELGRVRAGLPVRVTWDALPGREWQGIVDRLPSQVVTLGTRQVGEVLSLVENPERNLPPGANVNCHIEVQVVDHALTVPKEALRRQNDRFGVFLLAGDRLAWRVVQVGASSATRVSVEGLGESDRVALPVEATLESGMVVKPVFP
jgi:HlyD family secretion protein